MLSETKYRVLPIQNTYLKLIEQEDLEELYALLQLNRDYLRESIPGIDSIQSRDDLQNRWGKQREDSLQFGLWINKQIIGRCRLTRDEATSIADIGYWLSKEYQGHGFMTAAVNNLVEFAFTVWDVSRVEIHCGPDNVKSRGIPERLDFVNEGFASDKPPVEVNGNFFQTIVYSKLNPLHGP